MAKYLDDASSADLMVPASPKQINILFHTKIKGMAEPEFCRDGIASAWTLFTCLCEVANHFKGDRMGYIPEANGESLYRFYPRDYGMCADMKFGEGDAVYLVDFSVPQDLILSWQEAGAHVQVFDHHKSYIDKLFYKPGIREAMDFNFLNFNFNECGATLIFTEFRRMFPAIFANSLVPEFLLYVRDRDLGKNEMPRSKQVNAAMSAQREVVQRSIKKADMLLLTDIWPMFMLHNYWLELGSDHKYFFDVMEKIGEPMLVAYEARIDIVLDRAIREGSVYEYREFQAEESEPISVHVCYLEKEEGVFASEVGRGVVRHFEEQGTKLASLMVVGEEKLEVRAGDGMDLTPLVKELDGGGHPQACGSSLTKTAIESEKITTGKHKGDILYKMLLENNQSSIYLTRIVESN